MKSQVRDTSWLAVGGARMALQDGSCRHCRFFINIEDDGGEVVHHISCYLQFFHSFIGHLRCFVANFLVLIFLGLFCICAILIAFSISVNR